MRMKKGRHNWRDGNLNDVIPGGGLDTEIVSFNNHLRREKAALLKKQKERKLREKVRGLYSGDHENSDWVTNAHSSLHPSAQNYLNCLAFMTNQAADMRVTRNIWPWMRDARVYSISKNYYAALQVKVFELFLTSMNSQVSVIKERSGLVSLDMFDELFEEQTGSKNPERVDAVPFDNVILNMSTSFIEKIAREKEAQNPRLPFKSIYLSFESGIVFDYEHSLDCWARFGQEGLAGKFRPPMLTDAGSSTPMFTSEENPWNMTHAPTLMGVLLWETGDTRHVCEIIRYDVDDEGPSVFMNTGTVGDMRITDHGELVSLDDVREGQYGDHTLCHHVASKCRYNPTCSIAGAPVIWGFILDQITRKQRVIVHDDKNFRREFRKNKKRFGLGGKKKPPPPPFYVLDISDEPIHVSNKRKGDGGSGWTLGHRVEVSGHWRYVTCRGDLPLKNDLLDELVDKRGYQYVFLFGHELPDILQALTRRGKKPCGPDEWLAVKRIWVDSHEKGPEDSPLVPALRFRASTNEGGE